MEGVSPPFVPFEWEGWAVLQTKVVAPLEW